MKRVYQVCIPHTYHDYFDYEGGDLQPETGARVFVPFRNQIRLGIVINTGPKTNEEVELKYISSIIDKEALLSHELLALCTWVSRYYQSPLSEVIPLALPKKYRLGLHAELPTTDYYHLILPLEQAKQMIPARAKKQHELINLLGTCQKPVEKKKLTEQGFNSSQIHALLHAHLIALTQQPKLPIPSAIPLDLPPMLNKEQQDAVTTIAQKLHHFHCFLLQGVTGSGKTEVYFQIISTVLLQKKQVLVLVPEIGLTPQLLARFTSRFNEPIAVIHSNLNETERQIAWQLAKEQQVKIIIGTRAAVFTPMPGLGLIVIDEEHDTSLKQMDGVRYSARDTALMRAHLLNIPIILGSATPSLESLHNCSQKKYTRLRLNFKALSDSPLHYQLIDLRAQALQHGLATVTLSAIRAHLLNQRQVLVFINRRGFSPVILCHQCGWIPDCKACDSHMTFHKPLKHLICHHCGRTQNLLAACPHCLHNELIPIGAGTQRIQEFLSSQFPGVNVLRIDRDEVRTKHALDTHLKKIHQGEAQLIVGTQMLAKGHHFPGISLVVILDADSGLYNQDFRASEQLGQLITQVSGRAGRETTPGEVLIQTHLPQHPLLNMLIQEGYDKFAETLLEERRLAELPPFHYLAVIRAQGKSMGSILKFLHAIKNYMQHHPISILGPAPAPLPRKAHQYRMQLLIKSSSRTRLRNVLTQLREWVTMKHINKGVRWSIDVDPMDLS